MSYDATSFLIGVLIVLIPSVILFVRWLAGKGDTAKFDSWRSDRKDGMLRASINESMGNAIGLHWKHRLGAPIRCSPVIGYGRVFIGTDNGQVLALNPRNGATLWTYQAGGKVSTCPLVQRLIDVEYPMLWFTAEDGYLYALNAENGDFLWKTPGGDLPHNSAVKCQVPRTVFYNYQSDNVVTKTRAVEAVTGDVIWESIAHNISTATPLILHSSDMLIQGYTHQGKNVVCYRTTDGKPLWDLSTPGIGSAYTSGVVDAAYIRFYISIRNAEVRAYNVFNQHLVWEKRLPTETEVRGFALKQQASGDILIVTQLHHTFAIEASTSNTLWQVSHKGNLFDEVNRRTPAPAIYGNLVFHIEDGLKLTARRLNDGEEGWHFYLDSDTVSSPALSDRSIIIGTNAGTLYSFYGCSY